LEDPLEPVDSVIVSRAAKFVHCLPEGRLDVVEVGENGDNTPCASGMMSEGADFERLCDS
jgi:hypothetical protein